MTNGKNADKLFPVCIIHCCACRCSTLHTFPQVVWAAIIPYRDFCKTEKFGNTENEKKSIIWYLRKTEAEAGSVSIVQYQLLAHYCAEMYFITQFSPRPSWLLHQ